MNKMFLGCHLSTTKGYLNMGKEAISIGADTFAFFTRNPRGGKAKAIQMEDINSLNKLLKEHNYGPLVAHAPYTLNPCSKDPKVRDFAYLAMSEDIEKMELLPGNFYNFHPGSHVGQGADVAIDMISDLLNKIITKDQSTIILLETMAGKGTEVGSTFNQLAEIISKVNHSHKLGVCLDTCHVNDGGYDIVSNLDSVLDEFDDIIGLDKLKAMHINDSKNPLGARKDRHACIGEGTLGIDTIVNVLSHPKLSGIPCILETPQETLEGYGREIAMLREETGIKLNI